MYNYKVDKLNCIWYGGKKNNQDIVQFLYLNNNNYFRFYCERCHLIAKQTGKTYSGVTALQNTVLDIWDKTDKIDIMKILLGICNSERNYQTHHNLNGKTSYHQVGRVKNKIKKFISIWLSRQWGEFNLKGDVIADHMFIGCVAKFLRGYRNSTKQLFLGLVEKKSFVRLFIPVQNNYFHFF